MDIVWLIGMLFTAGLLDPHDNRSVWWFFKIALIWPIELGSYIAKRVEEKK